MAGRARPRHSGWSPATAKAGDGLGQTVAISNGTVLASAPGTDAPGHPNAGSIYAFGSFPSTAISIAPATPSGSNGWYVHPVSLAVSASDLDQTVTAIRCVLDPAAAPIGFGALPAACAFLAPGSGRCQRVARPLRVGRERSRLRGRSGQSVVQDRHGRSGREVRAHAQLHPQGQEVGWCAARVTDATSGPAAPIVAKRANVSRAGKKSVTLTGRDNAGNAKNVKCRYTVVAPKIPTKINFGFSIPPGAPFTIFTSLSAAKVPRGAKIDLGCKGRGCPFAHRTVKAPTTKLVCKRGHKHCKRKRAPALQNINLEGPLAGRHLAVNTLLSVAVTKPNTIGLIVTFKVRSNAAPAVTNKCLAPGSKKPGKGC